MDRSIRRIKIWQNSGKILFSPLNCISFRSIHFYSVSLNVSGIWAGIWSNGSTQMLSHPFSPYWNCEYTHDYRWEPSSTLHSIISTSDLFLNFRRERESAKRRAFFCPPKTKNSEIQQIILAETHPFPSISSCADFRDLTENRLSSVPVAGLGGLTHLKLRGNAELYDAFSPDHFPRMR